MDKLNALAQQVAAIWKRISFNQRVSIVLVDSNTTAKGRARNRRVVAHLRAG